MEALNPAEGPPTRSPLGHFTALGRGPLGFLSQCARDHGGLVALRLLNRRVFLLSDPDAIEALLVKNSSAFRKSITYRTPLMRRMFGDGVFTSEGGLWSRQRKLLHAWLQGERIEDYFSLLAEETENTLKLWNDGDHRDLHDDMMAMTSASFGRFIIRDIEPGDLQTLVHASSAFRERFARQFSLCAQLGSVLPIPSTLEFRRIMKRLHAGLQKRIIKRRQRPDFPGDFLSHLISHRDESGQPLADRLIRDELITLFFAGAETTALVLSWGLYLLGDAPQVHEQASCEIRALTGDRSDTAADAEQLPLVTNIVRETMRLYPPSWVVGREATRACLINGFECRKGDTFLMSQWILHRDARYFDRADQFDPDRWNAPAIRTLPRFAYFPFGGGPRACPGRSFAELAAVQALAQLLPAVRLKLLPRSIPVVPKASITLLPAGGIHAVITKSG